MFGTENVNIIYIFFNSLSWNETFKMANVMFTNEILRLNISIEKYIYNTWFACMDQSLVIINSKDIIVKEQEIQQ